MRILVALLFALNLNANVSPDYIDTYYYDPSITISFDKWSGEELNVRILSENGDLVLSETLNIQDTEGIKYNLKNLESGKYNVLLEDNLKLVEETVILFDGKIVKKEAVEFYKPMINLVNNQVRVNFLSINDPIEVKIYDQEGNKIYEELNTTEFSYNKVFDMSELARGTYMLIVSNSKVDNSFSISK